MASEPELDEKNFIQERGPKFIWAFLIVFLIFTFLMWGIGFWQRNLEREKRQEFPFYQVTNREFSIFLWQYPQFMRANTDFSDAYLPHFYSKNQIHVIPEFADEYVVAPPDVLYLYHTWKRLIGNFVVLRPIYKDLFENFLDSNLQWLPKFWKNAPPAYKNLIENLNELNVANLQALSDEAFPLEVRMAFLGWLNYMRESEEINQFLPSKEQIDSFLAAYPYYARNYWQNLFPDYLVNADLTWFLKTALFNFAQQQNRLD